MKTRYLALVSLGLSLGLGYLIAQTPPAAPAPGAAPGGPGGAPVEKTALELQMKRIGDAAGLFRAGQPADPSVAANKAETLKQVAIIKDAVTESMKLSPKYTPPDKTTDAQKAEYVQNFRATLQKFLTAVQAFEAAVVAGRTAETAALWSAAADVQRNDGHPVFRAPRGGRGGPGGPGGGRGGAGGPGGPGGGGPGAAPAGAPGAGAPPAARGN